MPHPSASLSRRSLLAAAAAFVATPSRAAEAIGAVTLLRGQAFADARALAEAAPLNLGELVRTAAQSRLEMRLGRTTIVSLGAATRLRLDRFIAESGGTLTLESGAALLGGPDGGFPQGLTVKSPYALLAVRGTRFFAGPLDKAFEVFVFRGAVEVRAAGRSVSLAAGQGLDIARRGAAPGPVHAWGEAKIARAVARA